MILGKEEEIQEDEKKKEARRRGRRRWMKKRMMRRKISKISLKMISETIWERTRKMSEARRTNNKTEER